MRRWCAASAVLLMIAVLPASASAAGYWYFCDPAQAYYPHVQTCPSGWREVPAGQTSPSPGPSLPRKVEEEAEQQRKNAESEREFYRSEARHKQETEDNRALLKTQWAPLLERISGIQSVITCGIYDDVQTADSAVLSIAMIMRNEKGELGLAADDKMVVMDYVKQALSDGKKALSPAACESAKANMSPASRAEVRQEIYHYAHMFDGR